MQKLWDEYRESLSLIDRHMENSNPDQEGEGTSHEQSRCLGISVSCSVLSKEVQAA